MLASQSPTSFVAPFAHAAGSGFIRTIPTNSQVGITAGAASLADGYPPVCFVPVAAGGTPPFGQDTNGILNQLSAGVQWNQVGGEPIYNSAFSTAIGGYPNGAILQSADGTGFWRSTTDNNVSNPDTGGANWLPMFFSTSASIPLTSANVTLSAAQYSKPIIVLTGVLTGAVALTFPAFVQEWDVINATTGAFAVTALTSGGVPVTLSQGGKTALRGNGTNIVVDALQVGTATQPGHAVNLGQFLASLSASGYFEIPVIVSGTQMTIIVQWLTTSPGSTPPGGGTSLANISWPIPFPNACLQASATADATGWSQNTAAAAVFSVTRTTFGALLGNFGTVTQTGQVRIIGIGY